MSEPFLGEIKIFGFTFAPRGWALCDGQILPINQNQSLYSLLGTTYGGNGRTDFALPDLRGRAPLHEDDSFSLGQKSGQENVFLTTAEMPAHTHPFQASEDSDTPVPTGALLGGPVITGGTAPAAPLLRSGEPGPDLKISPGDEATETGTDIVLQWQELTGELYADPPTGTALHSGSVTNAGASQGHNNMMPYLTLNFCIALQGLFPPETSEPAMSEPFIGEIRMFAGNFAPRGWAFCDGQLLAVSQNDALFSLLGTIYGGDGRTTFGLPDLRGRVPIHMGTGPGLTPRPIGRKSGTEQETVTVAALPSHTHALQASTANATSADPTGKVLAKPTTVDLYRPGTAPSAAMNSQAITNTGGSQAHTNLQPFLCIYFIIALFGVYPSRQ